MKKIIFLLLALLITLLFVGPVLGAQKVSNPGTRGGVDGIDVDPDIGIHNSYAWCSEVFKQEDSDYLWVGMNRDLGAALFGNTDSALSLSAFGIPDASNDKSGRIYRQRVSDTDAGWEMVYKNDAINGYRKMIVFNDDLYILAGLSNRTSLDKDYSVVLRFPKDFKTGDSPDIVFWENVTGKTTEYFRSAAVLDDKLYIGTFDSMIYVTDGKELQNLTPNKSAKDTGWLPALSLPDYGVMEDGAIWDLLAFNGSIYAFVAHVGDAYLPKQAFGVYKITPNQDGYTLKQIVGDTDALYPYGLGVSKNMLGFSRNVTASGFLSRSFGKDYVYVTTFANGPLFLGALAQGNYNAAFNNLFCPAQVYRFDENDSWEVIAGDESGEFIAVDNEGSQLPRASDPSQRAGFFLQDYQYQNVSFNQYVWWMTEYEGKLYASTWDMSVFKQYYGLLGLLVFNDITDGALVSLLINVLAIEEQLQSIFTDYSSVDVQAFAEELGAYLQAAKDSVEGDCKTGINEIIIGFSAIIAKYFPLEETGKLTYAILDLVKVVKAVDLDPNQVVIDTLAFVSATALYFIDKSNPAGFDLFASDNGTDFKPITVDGFGDPNNYGGRVLVPSEHGLFITTANPFQGGQVWRLNPIELGIHPNGPAKARLGRGDKAQMTVLVTDIPNNSELVLNYSSNLVDARLIKHETRKTVTDIIWDNTIKTIPFTDRKVYHVSENIIDYDTLMYDVIITPLKSGQEDLVLDFKIDGISKTRTIALAVDLGSGGVSEGRNPSLPTITVPTIPDKDPQLPWLNPFEDVSEDDWFYDDVAYVFLNELMIGVSSDKFNPNLPITRGMIVTVLYRIEKQPDISGLNNPFSDVPGSQYYTNAVIWAADKDIVLGYGNGKYGPEDKLTREQLAAILYRYEQFSGVIPPDTSLEIEFFDQNDISIYAIDPVAALAKQGIILGKPDGNFDPKGTATRAELAAMLHRYLTDPK